MNTQLKRLQHATTQVDLVYLEATQAIRDTDFITSVIFQNHFCHNGFPPRLGRPQKYGVATDLFCTGVIGHPGHMFLN